MAEQKKPFKCLGTKLNYLNFAHLGKEEEVGDREIGHVINHLTSQGTDQEIVDGARETDLLTGIGKGNDQGTNLLTGIGRGNDQGTNLLTGIGRGNDQETNLLTGIRTENDQGKSQGRNLETDRDPRKENVQRMRKQL